MKKNFSQIPCNLCNLCNLWLVIPVISFLITCTSDKQTEKEDAVKRIDSLEKKYLNPQHAAPDKTFLHECIAAYQDFAKKYPEDSLYCPEYLFRLSELQNATGEYRSALESLKRICENYPAHKKIPECLFLQGYYYQEFFKDTIHAKEFYTRLLAKYPNHDFADDAKALMSMFGKSEEEIIKGFEQKEK